MIRANHGDHLFQCSTGFAASSVSAGHRLVRWKRFVIRPARGSTAGQPTSRNASGSPRWQQEHSALSGPVSWGRSAKMDWVSEVLQFPVIIERGRGFSVEPQLLLELIFFLHTIPPHANFTNAFF